MSEDCFPPVVPENEEEVGEYYFESDPLALKDNVDYQQLLKALVKLQAQRVKAVKVRSMYIQNCPIFAMFN